MSSMADEATTSENTENAGESSDNKSSKPVCVIVLGMAGSGKTTFVQVSLSWFKRKSFYYLF